MSAARTAIVIPVHDARRQLPACLSSLAWAPAEDAVVVLVDAGSTDGGGAWVAANAPDAVVVSGSEAMWWTESVDLGCRFALGELGVRRLGLLNVDCVWTQAAFRAAVAALDDHPEAIVCSQVRDDETGATVFAGGVMLRSGMLTVNGVGGRTRLPPRSGWVDWCGGQGVLFDARVYAAVGGFDFRTFPHYFGDSDFCLRASRHGYRVWYCAESTVGNDQTTSGLSPLAPVERAAVWRTLSSRRSMYNLRDTIRFYTRHTGRSAPLALLHVYSLWAAWSVRGALRRLIGV
jgi:GT2 family glycosyltransferase